MACLVSIDFQAQERMYTELDKLEYYEATMERMKEEGNEIEVPVSNSTAEGKQHIALMSIHFSCFNALSAPTNRCMPSGTTLAMKKAMPFVELKGKSVSSSASNVATGAFWFDGLKRKRCSR